MLKLYNGAPLQQERKQKIHHVQYKVINPLVEKPSMMCVNDEASEKSKNESNANRQHLLASLH